MPPGKFLTHPGGQRRDPHQIRGLSAVESFVDLAGAVPRLIRAQGLTEIGQVHADERLGHLFPV